MKWTSYKNIRRLYKEDDFCQQKYLFTYYNYSYWGSSVALVHMLTEEIQKDFPQLSPEDIHISKAPCAPHELLLQFSIPKDDVDPRFLAAHFEPMSKILN